MTQNNETRYFVANLIFCRRAALDELEPVMLQNEISRSSDCRNACRVLSKSRLRILERISVYSKTAQWNQEAVFVAAMSSNTEAWIQRMFSFLHRSACESVPLGTFRIILRTSEAVPSDVIPCEPPNFRNCFSFRRHKRSWAHSEWPARLQRNGGSARPPAVNIQDDRLACIGSGKEPWAHRVVSPAILERQSRALF